MARAKKTAVKRTAAKSTATTELSVAGIQRNMRALQKDIVKKAKSGRDATSQRVSQEVATMRKKIATLRKDLDSAKLAERIKRAEKTTKAKVKQIEISLKAKAEEKLEQAKNSFANRWMNRQLADIQKKVLRAEKVGMARVNKLAQDATRKLEAAHQRAEQRAAGNFGRKTKTAKSAKKAAPKSRKRVVITKVKTVRRSRSATAAG